MDGSVSNNSNDDLLPKRFRACFKIIISSCILRAAAAFSLQPNKSSQAANKSKNENKMGNILENCWYFKLDSPKNGAYVLAYFLLAKRKSELHYFN